jgi:Tol biopolymer transport system component
MIRFRAAHTVRLLVGATLAFCVVACESGSITGPFARPDAKPIVYFRLDNGWELARVTPGGVPARLNLPMSATLFPALSPDGSRLAFVVESSPGGVYVGAADGSGARLLYPGWTDRITWSPDGTRLAIAVNGEILVVPLDGSTPQAITSAVDVHAGYPSWSSTGRIAFDTRGSFSFGSDIYTMASDGSDLRLIVSGDGSDARDPAWSPDGSRLAFALGQFGASSIFTVDQNGNDRRRLTPEPEWGFGWTDLGPEWSPSGQWIAFQREHIVCFGTDCESRYDVLVTRIDGRDTRNLTLTSPWGGVRPTW